MNYTNQLKNIDIKSPSWFIQLPFDDYTLVNTAWILLCILVLFSFISLFYKKGKRTHLLCFLLIVALFVLFAYIILRQNTNCLLFVSYPNDKKKIRDGIEDFITDATNANASVKAYDPSSTYIYFKKNVLHILANKEKVSEKSVLRKEMETLFEKYPYLPVAYIEKDTLKSLADADFIQMAK